ncbi:zincin-like metallopeptidase domain-containing protein, partial [Klebsiella pneumoniae]
GLCCADLDLPNILHDSHASYVGHWLGILRGDKTAIIHAAAKAEQAFAYLKSFGGAADDSVRDEPTAAAALAA